MGEISHAHDLLSLLLSSSVRNESSSSQNVSPVSLTSSTVSKLVDLSSVQAFSSQLVLGGKDTILRKASDILKNAAEKTHAGLERDEKYWLNSLQIRKRNWGLVPAPLPLGSVTGKEEDKLSKDFLISFGLENCEGFLFYCSPIIDEVCFQHRLTGYGTQLAIYSIKRVLRQTPPFFSHLDSGSASESL